MKERELSVGDLEGRTCSAAELAALEVWARNQVATNAQVLQALALPRGFLLQVIARDLREPQWHGIAPAELSSRAKETSPTLS
jgi:hypothetical protein